MASSIGSNPSTDNYEKGWGYWNDITGEASKAAAKVALQKIGNVPEPAAVLMVEAATRFNESTLLPHIKNLQNDVITPMLRTFFG